MTLICKEHVIYTSTEAVESAIDVKARVVLNGKSERGFILVWNKPEPPQLIKDLVEERTSLSNDLPFLQLTPVCSSGGVDQPDPLDPFTLVVRYSLASN